MASGTNMATSRGVFYSSLVGLGKLTPYELTPSLPHYPPLYLSVSYEQNSRMLLP